MRVPMKWLGRYVDLTGVTAQEVAKLLTARGLEVEGVEKQGEDMQNVVVGYLNTVEKMENSDHLQICSVDVGAEEALQIVTGAPNIKQGDLVPVALHGAILPNGMKIKKGKLRGVMSEGMLCSGEELCLGEEDYPSASVNGIMILREEYALGTDLREILGLDDEVLHAEATPNRPDLQSVIGIAREVAYAIGKPLVLPDITVKAESDSNINDFVKVDVKNGDLCPRYMARTVRDIKIAPSPKWMHDALVAAGIRSINNIVDITNYVMLEYGQPMHAFDLSCVANDHIVVRTPAEGEKTITTLDEKERALDENTLLICDENKPVGIAGIMGGLNSEITENTKTVLFESAKFNGYNIRLSSKRLGLMSEASQRFVKGVDIEGTEAALERACHLIEELGAGKVDRGVIDVQSCDLSRKHITARPDRVNALIALDVPTEKMVEILNGLDIPTTYEEDGLLHIEIPHFRDDIVEEADISEEVARIVGFDEIPYTLMRGDLVRGKLTARQIQVDDVRRTMCALGANECSTYSFTGNFAYDKLGLAADSPLRNSVRIMNPFGEDNALMRSTLAVSMLPVISTNANRKAKAFRLFEISNVYTAAAEKGELPAGKQMICVALYGANEDFFSLKGVVDALLAQLNVKNIDYVVGGEAYYHPGRKAELYVNDKLAGVLGEVHPDVLENYEINGRAYMAELELDVLFAGAEAEKKYKAIPRFPAIDRDLALVLDVQYTVGQVQKCIEKAGGKLLEKVELFDVYQGSHIEEGKKSLAYSLKFRDPEKTLTDDDVAALTKKILKSLEKDFGAALRS